MSKERLEKLRNGSTYSGEDIDWLMERAMLYEISRDSFIVVDKENERYREALEDISSSRNRSSFGFREIARKALEANK